MDERSTAMNARPVAVPGEEFGHEYLADYAPLLSGSPQMRAIRHSIESIADTDATVLVLGESGVGKEVIARAVHAASKRRDGAFVKVNCAALPAGLLESELFGHEKGPRCRPSSCTSSRISGSRESAGVKSSRWMPGSSRQRTGTWNKR
jgi:transcriptional regulator of acetoin/glycerol metabolism